MTGTSDWDDDDEKTVMGWLTPTDGAPASQGSGDGDAGDKTVIAPLPMSAVTHPPRALPDTSMAEDDPTLVPSRLPEVKPPMGPQAAAPPFGGEDDDKTVIADVPLDWFDTPTTPPSKPPAPVPSAPHAPLRASGEGQGDDLDWFDDDQQDDDKTVMMPLPVPPAMAPPASEAPFPAFQPKELWSDGDKIAQALRGHGLTGAMRSAARRARTGLTPLSRDHLLRQAGQRLRHPEDALPDDDVLETFRQLVTARIDDLAMEDLDVEPEMPSGLDDTEQAQWRALGKGLFVLLRDLERRAGDKPRIGRNRRLHEQLVRMGQDPFTGLPSSDMARYDPGGKVPRLRAQFLGFFGPFGAFPLNWTEEIHRWFKQGDASFVAFVDIFTERFQELFFRAWSDAHAITQFDHPTDDRFLSYLLSFTGNGTPAMQKRDAVADEVKARYAGLASGRIKSPVRLRQILQLHFNEMLTVRIEELVPTWLEFEPDTLSHIGRQSATMGMNMHLGSRVRSVGEKIRIHLEVRSIEDYFRLLPSGEDHPQLRDLVFWYLGEAYEIEAVLWLPEPEIQPAVMGKNAQLGWMACIAPTGGDPDKMVQVTVFTLAPPKAYDTQEAA